VTAESPEKGQALTLVSHHVCLVLEHCVSVVHTDAFPHPPEPQTPAEGEKGNEGGISEEHTVTRSPSAPAVYCTILTLLFEWLLPSHSSTPPLFYLLHSSLILSPLFHTKQMHTHSLTQSDTCEVLVQWSSVRREQNELAVNCSAKPPQSASQKPHERKSSEFEYLVDWKGRFTPPKMEILS